MKVHTKNGQITAGRLYPLSELKDFEVEDDELDVRGWDVTGADGKKLGEVTEMVVEPAALKVRYLIVEVDSELSMIEGDHYILVPIGAASLVEDHDLVLVKSLDAARINSYPVYDHTGTAIIRDYERNIRSYYTQDPVTEDDVDFYSHDIFSDDRFYGSRKHH